MKSRIMLVALLFSATVAAQELPSATVSAGSAPASKQTEPASDGKDTTSPEPGDWRDVSNYRFPALAQTVASAQNMAWALVLREYCANKRISDDFVRERLAWFSQLTARQETCKSLNDY